MKTFFAVVLALSVTGSAAFLGLNKPSAANRAVSAETIEAVETFLTKYPPNRPMAKANRFGVPAAITTKYDDAKPRRRLTDVPEDKLKTNFAALAKVYGADQALEMVKIMPIVLSFNKDWFGPSLDAFSEVFGEDKARAMVLRNPGLLGVKPSEAATSSEQTMVFSYLVAVTRPVSSILAPLLLFCVLSPGIEAATGIPVRSTFLSLFQ